MRKYAMPIALGIAAGAALAVPSTSGAAPVSQDSCPPGAVFSVGGTWDSTGQSTRAVTDRFAAQGYEVNQVTYPASFWPLGDQTYDVSVAEGKRALRSEIDNFHNTCPGSNIAVTGYSQGARIAGDVLGDIGEDGSVPESQVTGILYADPRNTNGGIETVAPTLVPGATMTGARPGFGGIEVQEVCIAGDGICNMPDPRDAPTVFVDSVFGYFTKHGGYQPVMAQPTPPAPLPVWPEPAVALPLPEVAHAVLDRLAQNLTPLATAAIGTTLGGR